MGRLVTVCLSIGFSGHLFVQNRNRKRCEVFPKLTIKTLERGQ